FPTDLPRPAFAGYAGANAFSAIDAQQAGRLSACAREQGISLFILLMAAWKVLLWRYSRQEDICVGMPVANRTHAQFEPLIGYFSNTLVLRSQLDGSM